MNFHRYYFYCVLIPSDFDIVYEHVNRKYKLNREKFGDFFKKDTSKIIPSCFIGGLISIFLSVIFLITSLLLPPQYPLTKWMSILFVVALLMGVTFVLTGLVMILYGGNGIFNRAFSLISFVLCEFILVEIGFTIVLLYVYPLFLFESIVGYVFASLILLFYLLIYLSYQAVVYTDVFVEFDNRTKKENRLKTLLNQNPVQLIVLMLIPFANVLLLANLLSTSSKEEGIVINKVD
ncbi:MAG: hypothetical protein ACTSU7_10440 [Candidatus Heimdallarchaeaceae archaeon]